MLAVLLGMVSCGQRSAPAPPVTSEPACEPAPPSDGACTAASVLAATQLSETGCVEGDEPIAAFVPYEVAASFFADGAAKQRWLLLPKGEPMQATRDGPWVLPVGAVVLKAMWVGDVRVETRFLVQEGEGEWAAVTFHHQGTGEAPLAAEEAEILVGPDRIPWLVPGGRCDDCHNGVPLALNGAQLAAEAACMAERGVLDEVVEPAATLVDPYGEADPTLRARSWLDVNCASCHGDDPLLFDDLHFDTPLAEMGICNVRPHKGLGLPDPYIVVPGEPERSVLSVRIHALDWTAMPPLGKHRVDAVGAALVDDWIRGLSSCD